MTASHPPTMKFCLLLYAFLQAVIGHSDFGFVFLEWPTWEIAAPGQELILRCSTNLAPDAISWYHNHRPIEFSPGRPSGDFDLSQYINVTSLGSEGSRLALTVAESRDVYKQQEGLYQCVARVGSISVTSLPGRVEVAFISEFVLESSELNSQLRATEGEPFSVPCTRPQSVPPAKMLYYKNGKLFDTSKVSDFYETLAGDLIVINARASSKGVYSCSALNEVLQQTVNSGHSTTIHVDRTSETSSPSMPFILNFQPLYTAAQGDKVRMLCLAFGDPQPRIWWSVHETASPPSYSLSDDSSSLVITSVSSDDEGLYRCHASNVQGVASSDVVLSVHEAPYLLEGAESKTVSEGDSVILSCVFQGRPMPTVAWVFNGNLLTSSRNLLLSGNQLDILNASRSQAGVYQCFAFNPLGAAEGTALLAVIPKTITSSPDSEDGLKVSSSHPREEKSDSMETKSSKRKSKDKKKKKKVFASRENGTSKPTKKVRKRNFQLPDKPTLAKLTDHSVMVTWNVSSHPEAIPIIFFKVQYRSSSRTKGDSDNRWKTVDEDILPHVRSHEVMGLTAGRFYRFRVAAIYANNDSKLGRSSKRFLLKEEPHLTPPESPPVLVNVTRQKDTSVVLRWSYNATSFTEGFIIYYRDATSAASYTKITLFGSSKRSHTVSHLTPNTSYDFKICSFNMGGSSAFSPRFTYLPYGANFSLSEERAEEPASPAAVVPVPQSDSEGITSHHLYIALGLGLSALLVIVTASFLVYNYKNKRIAGPPDASRKQLEKELDPLSADAKAQRKPLRVYRTPPGEAEESTDEACHCAGGRNAPSTRGDPRLHPSRLPLLESDCPSAMKQEELGAAIPLCALANCNNNNTSGGMVILARERENNEEFDTR